MADLHFTLEKIGPGRGPENYMLFACRGEGRGCPRNKYRQRKKHCDDCLPAADEHETVGQFKARLERGNA